MEGLAKSAPTQEAPVKEQLPEKQPTETSHTLMWEDVPIDLFRQYSVDLGTIPQKEIGKIRDIYRWAMQGEGMTLGKALNKVTELENRLGVADYGQYRWDKAWNWIRLQGQIDDLLLRQKSMRR